MILRVLAAIVTFAIVGDAFAFQHVSILNIRHSRICSSAPPVSVSPGLRRRTIIPRCCVNTEQKDSTISEKQAQFDFYVSVGSAKQGVPILRKSDDIKVSEDQAWKLLRSSITLDVAEENEKDQQLLTSYAFSALRKRKLLKAFGYIEATPASLPFQSRDVDVTTLEKTIGMSLAALTPRGTEFSWQLAGLAVCAAEYAIASAVGVDPIRTLIPITALAFIVDRALLSGAVFESVYRLLFPQYKEKVIKHEAGHFLLAYLLGCPIQGFFLSAWDATKAGISGQAGCIFFDNELSAGISANRVSRVAIDRYSIVVMAGIAAEAINYERAEGGASDESLLVSFLVDLTPP
eukprot:CAMPEP_0172208334 /NCGR_PEP_ID=MMETSP1050-20130122/34407_1 /TAXON_ID=233186 /ORGANISM="Cryptomonas curvata, Strain CCAP979/52" /LENGTH=347 /DNA_ID=CAMNT_0012887899 /DNA_START=66 /DNA_END=1106 /DNA_ORIENTATION=+